MNEPILLHGAPLPAAPLAPTIAHLLARAPDDAPCLVGGSASGDLVITRAQLAHAAAHMDLWRRAHDLKRGDAVLLVTPPSASEVHTAAALLALIACGLRVVAPMFSSPQLLALAIQHARPRALLADLSAADSAEIAAIRAPTAAIPHTPLLDILRLDPPPQPHAPPAHEPLEDALWLSTSGTSGTPRLVRHHERALLWSLTSQHAANLLDPARGIGHTLVPMLAHTMGLRAVLGALWMGRKALLVPHAWLESRPWDVVRLYEAHPPTHLTAGPALIHALLRYAAAFPRVAERVLPRLQTIISSGAPFDPALQAALPHVTLHDALGTSETQQLTNSAAGGAGLGAPLPGVTLRLTPDATDLYTLAASTPAAASGYAGDPDLPEWIETGDLVSWDGHALRFVRRADSVDSSGIGLRIDLGSLEGSLSAWLDRPVALCQHPASDALLALIFAPHDPDLSEQIAAWHDQRALVEGRDALWRSRIVAAACVDGAPPLHGPGKLDRAALRAAHSALLDALADPTSLDARRLAVHTPAPDAPAASTHHQPRRAHLMAALNLDWEVVGGASNHLTISRAGHTRQVVDLVGGFGSNLLGHAHPDLIAAATAALQAVPLLEQGSARPHAARLAAALSARVGRDTRRRYVVALSSTGAEAAEVALKHAMFALRAQIDAHHASLQQRLGADQPALVREWITDNEARLSTLRPLLISVSRGYHGKTLGALHGMGDDAQRAPLAPLLGADTLRVSATPSDDDRRRIRAAVAAHTISLNGELTLPYVLAILAEPLQGEGGVREVSLPWLDEVRGLCGAPLIMDEVQSGLGRTGTFLASAGLRADYYLLGKALGGGVAKIAATLIDHARYLPAFDDLRGSTFGADPMSCAVALATLDLIEVHDVPRLARQLGARLGAMFERVCGRHPAVMEASGRGAMWGVRLKVAPQRSTLLDALAARGLGYLASTYLLHVHGLRLLPTLSAPDTLRVEPSVWLDDDAIASLERGLDALAEALEDANLFELIAHLVAPLDQLESLRPMARMYAQQDPATRPFQIVREAPALGARRVAFVHNPVQPTKLLLADAPPLALLTASQRLDLIARFELLVELGPMPSFTRNFFDGAVWMFGITLGATPTTLEHLKRTGDLALVRAQLQRALELAAEAGCEVVVFGAHTSIVTDGAATLHPPPGVQISSGNSFTTAAMLDRLERACPRPLTDVTIGVVGATGSIGAALSGLLAALPSSRPLHLIGRPGAQARLDALAATLAAKRPTITGCDLSALTACDVILCATSAAEPILLPAHIAPDRPVIIADVSQPAAVHPQTAALPHVTLVPAGYVKLPRDPDFVMSAHTGPGQSFACAAEGILMGLEPQPHLKLHGQLDAATIATLRALGAKHGLSG